MIARLHRPWAYALSLAVHAGAVIVLAADLAPAPAAPTPVVELTMLDFAVEEEMPMDPVQEIVAAPAPPPPPPPAPPQPVSIEEPPPVVESRAAKAPIVAAPPPPPPPRPPLRPRLADPAPLDATPTPMVESPPAPVQSRPVETAAIAAPPVPEALVALQQTRAAPSAQTGPPPSYLRLIQLRLERARVYPVAAQRRRQQGVAYLHFRLNREGRVLSWRVSRSSGHDLLDREVEAMIQRAAPLPPMPPEMEQAELEVEVPIQFTLR